MSDFIIIFLLINLGYFAGRAASRCRHYKDDIGRDDE